MDIAILQNMASALAPDALLRGKATGAVAITGIAMLVAPHPAAAMCETPRTQSERIVFARNIVRTSAVIVEATIVRRYDWKNPEIVSVQKTYKGPKKRFWRLWLPTPTDQMLSIEAPTTGKSVGSKMLLALTPRHGSLVVTECNARTIFDDGIRDLVISLAKSGSQEIE